jgi:holliday junction DNA helicase RuvA
MLKKPEQRWNGFGSEAPTWATHGEWWMIARLKGRVDAVEMDSAIIDVGGVGYLVMCSARTLRRLGSTGQAVTLEIETRVREDAFDLYGFFDRGERDWFRRLTTVQGVGSRVALAILSVLEPDQIVTAIAAQDRKALERADGVGPKLAARIVNELKDKVGDLRLGAAASAGAPVPAAGGGIASRPDAVLIDDAVSALVNLGYKRSDAFGAVVGVVSKLGADAAFNTVIRESLKELSPA